MDVRKLGLATGLLALIAGTVYFSSDTQASLKPPKPVPPVKVSSVQSTKSTMPNGYNPSLVIRDPFAAPDYARPQTVAKPSAPQRNSSAAAPKVQKAIPPALSGIVSAGGKNTAILAYGGESRSYNVNEYAGAYKIIAIYPDKVLLSSPYGRLTLTMEGD